MRPRLFAQLTAPIVIAVAIVFGSGAANLLAIQSIPANVQEAPSGGGNTQYTVNNTSSTITPGGKFDISIFLSTTTGSSPSTTNSGWTAESVDATSWGQDMTGEGLTWQQYTGLSYTTAFPGNPFELNGFFLDYIFNSDTDTISFPNQPIFPGAGLGGFFFAGSPSSTFFVDGPPDGTTSFTPGSASLVHYSGTSTDVPEPTSLIGLAILALSGLGSRRRRRQVS
jgi:hypothetical protein